MMQGRDTGTGMHIQSRDLLYIRLCDMSHSRIQEIMCHMLIHQDGYSALIWATLHDRATMVALLLDRGACIDNADKVKSLPDNGCK